MIQCSAPSIKHRLSLSHFYRPSLFAILLEKLFTAPANKENPHKIKTELNETGGIGKSWDLLYFGHHLGDTVKNPQSGQNQCNGPDDLYLIHLFFGHRSTCLSVVVMEF